MRADEIFVYFADFEYLAKWEVHDLVAGDELGDCTASLAVGDQFWCIQRCTGPIPSEASVVLSARMWFFGLG